GDLLAHQGDATREYARGGEQLVLGRLHQQALAGAVGVKAGDARGEHADDRQHHGELGGDAELHGASTRAAESPETMRSHSRVRRSTCSTGSSQSRRSAAVWWLGWLRVLL